MITIKQYLDALEIVNQYKQQQQQLKIEETMQQVSEQERMQMIKDTVQQIIKDEGIDNTKRRDIAQKRQAIMYWLRANTTMTLFEIAAIFNRDHSSVIHATKIADNAVKFKDHIFIQNAQVVYSRLEPYKRKRNK
jgi:chromosomal replication initiation ATPase DnaA